MACRESYATTCSRYKAMTLTKIGTVRQVSAVPSLRTAFWGRGDDKKLSALSSRLVPAIRSVRKRTFSATYPHCHYNPTKEKGDSRVVATATPRNVAEPEYLTRVPGNAFKVPMLDS